MALNDVFRFNRTPLGLDIKVGGATIQFRDGHVILPGKVTADEASTEVGSLWNNSDTGANRQRDSAGVRDL